MASRASGFQLGLAVGRRRVRKDSRDATHRRPSDERNRRSTLSSIIKDAPFSVIRIGITALAASLRCLEGIRAVAAKARVNHGFQQKWLRLACRPVQSEITQDAWRGLRCFLNCTWLTCNADVEHGSRYNAVVRFRYRLQRTRSVLKRRCRGACMECSHVDR